MDSELQQLFARIEARRTELFAPIEGLDDERLNRRPGEDQWSVIQVLCHLTTAEEASLADVRRRLSDASSIGKAGIKSAFKSAVLAAALRSGLRFKAPARAAQVPEEQDFETTRRRWDEVRAQWQTTLESVSPELVDKAIFRHPRAGEMSLAQALRFMDGHLRHHMKQIDRILEATA